EFLAALLDLKTPAVEDLLYTVFRRFDLQSEGRITEHEFAALLESGGLQIGGGSSGGAAQLPREVVQEAVKDMDVDGDGLISFQDFISFVRRDFSASPRRGVSALSLPVASLAGLASPRTGPLLADAALVASGASSPVASAA